MKMSGNALEYAVKEVFTTEETFVTRLNDFLHKLTIGLPTLPTELNTGYSQKLSAVSVALQSGMPYRMVI